MYILVVYFNFYAFRLVMSLPGVKGGGVKKMWWENQGKWPLLGARDTRSKKKK